MPLIDVYKNNCIYFQYIKKFNLFKQLVYRILNLVNRFF